MEYRYLGNSGLRVSVLSLGAWLTWGATLSEDVAFATMKGNIIFVDTQIILKKNCR
jgi:aryl-alcohol dehydrogenase-like predicted oxidoreductase